MIHVAGAGRGWEGDVGPYCSVIEVTMMVLGFPLGGQPMEGFEQRSDIQGVTVSYAEHVLRPRMEAERPD